MLAVSSSGEDFIVIDDLTTCAEVIIRVKLKAATWQCQYLNIPKCEESFDGKIPQMIQTFLFFITFSTICSHIFFLFPHTHLQSFITLTMTRKLQTVDNLQEAVSVLLVLFAAF